LVVGDIIKVKAGMNIPVDGIMIKASGVQTNEAAMTGESDELKKDSLDICLLRKEEKEEELQMYTGKDGIKKKGTSHDLPSPVLLSGT
jgi:P-type E1-E2 ATPase